MPDGLSAECRLYATEESPDRLHAAQALVQKMGLQNLRVYVSGENLLTITSLSKTMDPETCGAGYQSNSQANGTVYPLSKTYSFGLSVNF